MKIGRPPLAKKEKKSKITGVRLDISERKLLEKAAKARKWSLSNWMRDVLLSTAKRDLVRLTKEASVNS